MARIAVGGFQHETNTFAPIKTPFEAFEKADAWPPLASGKQMLEKIHGVHLPVNGAISALKHLGHDIVPLTWCSATPAAHVTEDAFERISELFLQGLRDAGKIDGIYLDLHGAMVCEHVEDGEGELLQRIRRQVGEQVPITVSLDLHCNITDAMVNNSNLLDIFRTYPHIDMGATGARAAAALHRLIHKKEVWFTALKQPDFLVPLNWGCTLTEPAKSLYSGIDVGLGKDMISRSLGMGFPLSDVKDAGPAVVAYGLSRSAAEDSALELLDKVNAKESEFTGKMWNPVDAVEHAVANADAAKWPTLLVDTQDNPGGGGTGDTTGLLRALVECNAHGSIVATICDAEFASQAHESGANTTISGNLGGKLTPGDTPFIGEFRILKTAHGQFTATGPMYNGARMVFGPMALVEVSGVRVIVASQAEQIADQSILRHVGIEASHEPIIALKSSVHFRNDFEDLAREILLVAAPGVVPADISRLEYENLRSGVRR